MLLVRFSNQKLLPIVFTPVVFMLLLPHVQVYGGDTLKNLDLEISKLVDSSKVSVVTVASKFSREVYVEKERSILSFFKTEVEKKSITYMNIGSGLILDNKGHIVTRSSIVWGSETNVVTLSDGKEFSAEFIGHDPRTGFAVIKIASDGLKPPRFGNSEDVTPGSWIVVIGNSLGVYPSVVLGSINGLRNDGIIQISATLDPGNNGSSVFNTKGEVIGVVAARLKTTEGLSDSFGRNDFGETNLAYPINWIRRIAQDIIEFGYVRKGWLGVVGFRNGDKPKISQVVDNSPAQKAGLSVGDVIVRFAGKEINNLSELARLVEYTNPDQTVTLEYLRNGQLRNVDITMGEKAGSDLGDSHATVSAEFMNNQGIKSMMRGSPVNWNKQKQLFESRIKTLEKELQQLKKMLDSN
jgi:serine protease Do